MGTPQREGAIVKKIRIILLLTACICLSGCGNASQHSADPDSAYKFPSELSCIYLYPKDEGAGTDITVTLDYAGKLRSTEPEYMHGWQVQAASDGTITTKEGARYSHLYWEGDSSVSYDFRRGFVVAGPETRTFLEAQLPALGLNEQETEDFLSYWLPYMEDNPYNMIAFQGRAYNDAVSLNVTPEPDTVIRVFMAWQALEEPVDLPLQEPPHMQRSGYTVVEWGGTCLEGS